MGAIRVAYGSVLYLIMPVSYDHLINVDTWENGRLLRQQGSSVTTTLVETDALLFSQDALTDFPPHILILLSLDLDIYVIDKVTQCQNSHLKDSDPESVGNSRCLLSSYELSTMQWIQNARESIDDGQKWLEKRTLSFTANL